MLSRRVLLVAFLCAGAGALTAQGLFDRPYTKEKVVYAELDGDKLVMTLYIPKGEAASPRPAIGLFHGGAWLMGTRHQVSWYARHFAEAGYVAATVGYRKMPKYTFPACVYDAKAAIRWLRSHAEEYGIDPDRIAASGHSAGGHLAMMLGTTADNPRFEGVEAPAVSSEVAAVISVYGAVDLTAFRTEQKGLLKHAKAKYLDVFTRSEAKDGEDPLVVASPVYHIDQNTAPTLLLQGDSDSLVPPKASATAEKALKAAGVPVRRVVYPGYGHSFDYLAPRRRPMVLAEMLGFLAEYMPENKDHGQGE